MTTPTILRQAVALKKNARAILLLASLSLAASARADFQLDFVYDPVTGATTASYLGSWGSWAGAVHDSPSTSAGITPGGLAHFAGTNDYLLTSTFTGATIPWSVNTSSSGFSGASWGFGPGIVDAPYGYTANTVISGTIVFAGMNLTAFGFDATEIANGGTVGSGNFIVHWTASNAIPEPATSAAMLGVSALGLAWSLRRQRREV
jgi:hypothetical protein